MVSPQIDGYKPFYDKVIGEIENDTEIDVIYYPLCNNVIFTGLDSSGKITIQEDQIASYMIGNGTGVIKNALGDFDGENLIFPDEYNGKPITKIDKFAFNGYSKIKTLILPNNIDVIGDRAFQGCSNLKKIRISKGNLESLTFYGCTNLEEAILGEGSIRVGSAVFSGCSKLSKLLIISEDFVLSSYSPFFGCAKLTNININNTNQSYKVIDGILYSIDGKKVILYPVAKEDKEISIIDSVNDIGFASFSNTINLEKVIIPTSVDKVQSRAFEGGQKLEQVTIGAKTINSQAFYGCSKLKAVEFNGSSINIGEVCFCNDSELENVIFNTQSIKIGAYNVFQNCNKLKEIKIGENNTQYKIIDGVLFTSDEKTIVLYPVAKELDEYIIPSSVQKIGNSAFHNAINLERISIPKTVIEVEYRAFEDCEKLAKVEIGASVIGVQAFYSCGNLEEVLMLDMLNSIGNSAFAQNSKLTSVTYKSTIEDWNKISKINSWKTSSPFNVVTCTNGSVNV